MPRVSVIIPAYNVAVYVAASIRSVLAQTFEDFELIVIDDGSTDRTAEIARGFDDPRVRVVTQLNRGLAGARNAGIREARGDYVAFLDADDLWLPTKLARHVEHLDRSRWVGVSYSQSLFMDDAGRSMRYLQSPKLRNVSCRDVFLRNPVGNGSAPVIRMAALHEISFPGPRRTGRQLCYFDESFRQSEDIECWLRIALLTYWRFEGIGAPLTLYRVNGGGLSANLDAQLQSWEQMVAKLQPMAPYFFARHTNEARGYQLRYLARRAIRSGRPAKGLEMLNRALREHPRMMLEEPVRTAVTLAAAVVGLAIPAGAYRMLESVGMRLSQSWMGAAFSLIRPGRRAAV